MTVGIAPVNNPAGGDRSPSPVGVGFIGWESTYVQTGVGKGTFIIPASAVPSDMGGVPLSVADGSAYWDDSGNYNYHYGDYVSGPLIFWYDASGYWANPPNSYGQWFVVDWGDGSPREPTFTPFSGTTSGITVDGVQYYPGAATTHVYASNGTKTVTLYIYTFLPSSPAWSYDWLHPDLVDWSNTGAFWDVQSIGTFPVVCNDGPSYAGYTGPKTMCGLSVCELGEYGHDDTYTPRAMVMSIPWSDMRTGTASGDMPATHLSKPIGEIDNNGYWPGELFRPAAYDGFDVGHNNDLASTADLVLANIDAFSLASVTPPDGYRGPWGGSDVTYWSYDDLLFGLDGSGRMLIEGNDSLAGTFYYTDVWDKFYYTTLGSTGPDLGTKQRFPGNLRMFDHGPQPIPRLRMVYSDTEILIEVGDGNLLVVNTTSNAWYFLTTLYQFKVGEFFLGEGRGFDVQRRAGGGFWLFTTRSNSPTDTPHAPVHPIILGVGRDGAINYDVRTPNHTFSTAFSPGDFPDIGGATWQVESVIGDPDDSNVVYALTGYMDPYPENRRTAANLWQGPQWNADNGWVRYVRLVSVVFRCTIGETPVPCVWLQHPNWFSTDGITPYPDHVRMPTIYLSGAWWTDSSYSGGSWQGPTKPIPTLAITDTVLPKNVVFNPRPTGV